MAAGLPVLGSQVSGTEDWVVAGRTGWLFPPGDVEAFVQALAAAGDTSLADLKRLGGQARQMVEQQASIPAVVDSLQDTYRRLLAGHAPVAARLS
jgi:glycosyltransferase involved in cell wall biosynthesis